jgi:hypothetical protein
MMPPYMLRLCGYDHETFLSELSLSRSAAYKFGNSSIQICFVYTKIFRNEVWERKFITVSEAELHRSSLIVISIFFFLADDLGRLMRDLFDESSHCSAELIAIFRRIFLHFTFMSALPLLRLDEGVTGNGVPSAQDIRNRFRRLASIFAILYTFASEETWCFRVFAGDISGACLPGICAIYPDGQERDLHLLIDEVEKTF